MTQIIILGSIGVGKTTLINQLKTCDKFKNYTIKNEDDIIKNELFKKLYSKEFDEDFRFELIAFELRLKSFLNNNYNSISERSIFDSFYVFIKMKYDQGKITEKEYNLFVEYFKLVYEKLKEQKDIVFIHLSCSLETQLERIRNRNREYENIEEDYLTCLNSYYENIEKKLKEEIYPSLNSNSKYFYIKFMTDKNENILEKICELEI